jgi:hypothetical protein
MTGFHITAQWTNKQWFLHWTHRHIMLFYELISYKWICSSRIKQYCGRYRVDRKRTKHNARSVLRLLHSHVVQLAAHIILLCHIAWSAWISRARWSRWLSNFLNISPLGSLHPAFRTVIGIMSQLARLQTSIRLHRSGVHHWCTLSMSWAVLLEVWSAGSLWVEALGLLEWALQLYVLRILSTMSSRAERWVLWKAIAWTSVAVGLSLGLELTLLLSELSALVLQANCLVQQGSEVWKSMALKLVIHWPNQSIQTAFLSLRVSVDLVWGVARQLSKFVDIFVHKRIALFQSKELPLLQIHYPIRNVMCIESIPVL